jgi:hypothetical protein
MYIHTDCIDPAASRIWPVDEFLTLMRFARDRRMHRFLWLELSLFLGFMRVSDFFHLAFSTTASCDTPLWREPGCRIVKFVMKKLLPTHSQFADLGMVSDDDLHRIWGYIGGGHRRRTEIPPVPESNFGVSLARLGVWEPAAAADGPAVVDTSFLGIESAIIATFTSEIVVAVHSGTLEFLPNEQFESALRLLSHARGLTGFGADLLVESSRVRLAAFARKSAGFRKMLRSLLLEVKSEGVLGFLLELYGIAGTVRLYGAKKFVLNYDISVGVKFEHKRIFCGVPRTGVLAFALLTYMNCSISDLPELFDRDELVEQFEMLSDVCLSVPSQMKEMMLEFVVRERIKRRAPLAELMADFHRMFRLNIHEMLLEGVDPLEVANFVTTRDMSSYSVDEMLWILNRFPTPD